MAISTSAEQSPPPPPVKNKVHFLRVDDGTVRGQRMIFDVSLGPMSFVCTAAGVMPYRVNSITHQVEFLMHSSFNEEQSYDGVLTDFGGKAESYDTSPQACAFREFLEEARSLYGHSLERVPGLVRQHLTSFIRHARSALFHPGSKYITFFWKLPHWWMPARVETPELICHWIPYEDIEAGPEAFLGRVHPRLQHPVLLKKMGQIVERELAALQVEMPCWDHPPPPPPPPPPRRKPHPIPQPPANAYRTKRYQLVAPAG